MNSSIAVSPRASVLRASPAATSGRALIVLVFVMAQLANAAVLAGGYFITVNLWLGGGLLSLSVLLLVGAACVVRWWS